MLIERESIARSAIAISRYHETSSSKSPLLSRCVSMQDEQTRMINDTSRSTTKVDDAQSCNNACKCSLRAPIKLSTGFMYKHFPRLVFDLESQMCEKQLKNVWGENSSHD